MMMECQKNVKEYTFADGTVVYSAPSGEQCAKSPRNLDDVYKSLGELRMRIDAVATKLEESTGWWHGLSARVHRERDKLDDVIVKLDQLTTKLDQLTTSTGQLWVQSDSLRARLESMEADVQDARTDWLPGIERRLAATDQVARAAVASTGQPYYSTVTKLPDCEPVSVTYVDEEGEEQDAPVNRGGMGRVFGGWPKKQVWPE